MQTWLLILRGDPADGGHPIGVVTDRELCRAAVCAAWAAFQQLYTEERHDPALREGVEGMERRLRAAAAELDGDTDSSRSDAPGTSAGPRTPGDDRALELVRDEAAGCVRPKAGAP